MDIDCIVLFDLRDNLEVDSLSEIKSAALTIILALHKQSLAHGFTLVKVEETASGIFLEPTNNLEPIQYAIEHILEKKIIRNIEAIDYIKEVSKSIGEKVLSLTIFSNGSKELISDEYLKLQGNLEVFFLGPSKCNMAALQAQANKFASGDASYCLDFIDRVNMIDQMQQGNEISHDTEKATTVDIPNKEIEVVQMTEPSQQPAPVTNSKINFTSTKRLDVPRRAKAGGRPPTKKKRAAVATKTDESVVQPVVKAEPVPEPQPVPEKRSAAPQKPLPDVPAAAAQPLTKTQSSPRQASPRTDHVAVEARPAIETKPAASETSPVTEKRSGAPQKPLPEIPVVEPQAKPESPVEPQLQSSNETQHVLETSPRSGAPKKPLPEIPVPKPQIAPPSPRKEEPKFSSRVEITVISNAVADSLFKNQTETKPDSPPKDTPNSDVKDTTSASPTPETKNEEEPQPNTNATATKTLEPETPPIRPPSRYGMDIPESEKIDRSIKQAMWRTYRKTDIAENSPQSNQSNESDSSEYSSMEQVKENPRHSNTSQTSQTSQASQVSGTKSQRSSGSPQDQKRVWVKVNTEGMGSSRYTVYQIEILVKGKSITGWKRYSEIRTLYDTLHSSVKSEFGRFPSKTSNKMDTMVIYTRQQYFLKFFTKLVDINQDGVVKFLESESS